jgi:Protein of unknown function (DUF3417)
MPTALESPIHPEPTINLLRELALDLGAVWKRHSDGLWRQIDPDVWLITRNPWLMLQQASGQMLNSMANDKACGVKSSTSFSPGERPAALLPGLKKHTLALL